MEFEEDQQEALDAALDMIINTEADKRAGHIKTEYDASCTANARLYKENKDLQRKLKSITDIKVGSLFGGFKPGDYIYVRYQENIFEPCKKCSGTGNVAAKYAGTDIMAPCPDCKKGSVACGIKIIARRKQISRCSIIAKTAEYSDENHLSAALIMLVNDNYTELPLSDIFRTEEDALKEA